MTWLMLVIFFSVDGSASAQVDTTKTQQECVIRLNSVKSQVEANHPPELASVRFYCIAVTGPQTAKEG